jgi:hypothetical protein
MRYTLLLFLCMISLRLYALDLPPDAPTSPLKSPKEIIDIQLKALDLLHQRTAQTLQQIEELKNQTADYKRIQEQYLDDIENRRLLASMLHAADNLLQGIKNAHMADLFEPEFLSELTTLTQLQKKMSLPPPPLKAPSNAP